MHNLVSDLFRRTAGPPPPSTISSAAAGFLGMGFVVRACTLAGGGCRRPDKKKNRIHREGGRPGVVHVHAAAAAPAPDRKNDSVAAKSRRRASLGPRRCPGGDRQTRGGLEPKAYVRLRDIIYCRRRSTWFRVIDSVGVPLNGLKARVPVAPLSYRCAGLSRTEKRNNNNNKKLLRGYKLKTGGGGLCVPARACEMFAPPQPPTVINLSIIYDRFSGRQGYPPSFKCVNVYWRRGQRRQTLFCRPFPRHTVFARKSALNVLGASAVFFVTIIIYSTPIFSLCL